MDRKQMENYIMDNSWYDWSILKNCSNEQIVELYNRIKSQNN